MKIQVIGSGCATCKKLHEITQKAVNDLGIKIKVDYLTGSEGTQTIIKMGIMQSPVLAVNGEPVMIGFTPDIEKIKKVIKTGVKTEEAPACSCGSKC